MIRTVMLFVTLLLSINSFAENDVRPVEDVMANTSNQFIYAFFGKDLLLYYLSNAQDVAAVEEATDNDLTALAKPFNVATGKLFVIGLTLIYFLVLGYFVIRLAMLGLETGWLLQKDGESNMSNAEKKGLVFKVLILCSLAIIPIPLKNGLVEDTFYTNLATVLLFDMLGRAHEKADEATLTLIESQRQPLKTIALPAAESKMNDMQALNRFYTCVRLQYGRSETGEHSLPMKFYPDETDAIKGRVSTGLCTLEVTFGVDFHSDKILERINAESPDLGLTDGMFLAAQKEAFPTLLEELFAGSLRFSKYLSKPSTSSSWNDGEHSFKDQTSAVLNIPQLKRWPERCDEIESWSPTPGFISKRDRYYFHHLSARCLSNKVAARLVYPNSYDAMANYLGNNTRVRRELAMCVDQASMSRVLESSRFVAQYGVGASASPNIEQIALDTCVSNLCAQSALNEGGMYACANAMGLYETRLNDIRIKSRGTMMLGFYMFDLFLYHPPSAASKHVFNKFKMEFIGYASPINDIGEGTVPYMTVQVPIPESSNNVTDFYGIMYDISKDFSRTELPSIYEPLDTGNFFEGLIGGTRLLTCVKNPLQIHGGYVCGNVPQEFSRFGLTMMKNLVVLKAILTVGQTTGQIMRRSPIASGDTTTSPGAMSAVRTTAMTVIGVFGDTSNIEGLANGILDFKLNITDEFGHLNTVEVNKFANTLMVKAFASMAYIGHDTALVSFINTALMFGLLLSVFFAFLVPLFPMLIFISALIKFSYLLFSTIILHGFKLVDAGTYKDGDLLNERLDKVFSDWLALLLKFPLTVIGVVLAWLMSNVIISHVLSSMNLSFATNDGAHGMIDVTVLLATSLIVIFIVYNMVLTVIESFYDFTVEWILGTMHGSPFSDAKAISWRDSKQVLTLMGKN
jgi:hypothetical protein